ncbi:MAG: NAD(P)-dependent oxidoreductase [Bacteroidetes bacterium]|nr:MAG: NAD(P)-dependent oxidoreductase [Bacteroidota bacterium]
MNKIVLVTGATSGIGKAVAEEFAKLSYNIIIVGRREKRLHELKAYLEKQYKVNILLLPIDLRNKQIVKETVANFPENWRNIDVLVNNAGLGLGLTSMEKANPDDWDIMIDTNIKAVLYLSREIMPFMVARKSGHIINIGSTVAKQVPKNVNIYAATKHALDAISQGMRADLLEKNIKVTQVNPGYVETEFSLVNNRGDKELAKKTYEGFTPLKPIDVAEVVTYVASLPKHVNINEILVTPFDEADVYNLKRD